jgi:hypothetical protein
MSLVGDQGDEIPSFRRIIKALESDGSAMMHRGS